MDGILTSLFSRPEWFSVIGLAIDVIAVIAIVWDIVITRREPLAFNPSDTILDRIKHYKITTACLFLLALGFLLQMYGSWPR